MFVVFKHKTNFNQVQYTGVKNISFNGTAYTVTLADNSTASYNASDWHIWQFN